jgi:hypothetical protein
MAVKVKNKSGNKKVKIYKVPASEKQFVQEELGLSIYPDKRTQTPTLELPKSKHPKVSVYNDIDLNKWKEYGDIITDSLWLLGARDKTGVHTGELHGNFIPQIPHQAMLRYTKRGEIVLDTFSGSETILLECRRLNKTYE